MGISFDDLVVMVSLFSDVFWKPIITFPK